MKSNVTLVRCLVCFVFLLGAFSANAQQNPKYVCDINAGAAIDLGMDVVGDVLTRDGGYWDQVVPGTTTVIKHDVSNVLILAGLEPGEYEFIYTATNNVCLSPGGTRTAKVVIQQTPKDFSHTVFACTGDTPTLDLSTIISAGYGAPVNFSLVSPVPGVTLTGNALAIGSYTGTIEVNYDVTYADGDGSCNGPATIFVNVIRDDAAPVLTVTNVTYCETEAPLSINLSALSGATTTGGTWSSSSSNVTVSGAAATFTGTQPAAGTYEFDYTWPASSCYGAGSAKLTVVVSGAGLTLPANPCDEICKTTNPSRIYDLTLEGLGLAVPSTTGRWVLVSQPVAQSIAIDVTDGLFEVALAKAGVFEYKYIVSNVADVCGLSGETTLTLTVGDVSGGTVSDGRMQLCALDLADKTGNFNLSSFIPGIPSGATWTGPAGVTIVGTNNDEVAYSELNDLGVGTYRFTFNYTSSGCGSSIGEGYLYVTITNNMDLSDAIELNFCRPDMSSALNLNTVIGAELEGTWEVSGGNATVSTEGIFTEGGAASGPVSYTVVFTSTGNASACAVPGTITITINVNDDSF